MATYTYTEDVKDINTLEKALIWLGVYDAGISIVINGSKVVTVTTESPKASVDTAITEASPGGLIYEKAVKIAEVELNTSILASSGVNFTRPSDSAVNKGPLELTQESRGSMRDMLSDYDDGYFSLPQLVSTLDGKGVELFTRADIEEALHQIVNRGIYLLNDGTNGDSSRGETGLIMDILACTTTLEVQAITDTRI